MGKTKDEEKQKAYDLFCNTALSQKDIAAVIAVSPQQLGKWVNQGNWEIYRQAHQTSLPAIIQSYYLQIAAINKEVKEKYNGVPSAEHTDSICKITNSIEKLNKKHNLSAYHRILREYLEWAMKNNADTAKLFGPSMLEFLREKAKTLKDDQSL